MKISIHPATQLTIEDVVKNEKKEGGGSFYLETPFLKLNKFNIGKYNSVDVPSSTVQFHTHSSHCPNNVCLIGVPSPADIGEFKEAVWARETVVHCVYAEEGTYCMRNIGAEPPSGSSWKGKLVRDLKAFRNKQTKVSFLRHEGPEKYEHFQNQWRKRVRKCGIDIEFYPVGMCPQFSLEECVR